MVISHKLLFQVFMDVRNSYNYLDRGPCMEILRGYEMCQNTVRLISHHWGNLLFVPKTSRFLGMDFGTGRLFMQDDPASPIIFNIVVDAVVRLV